MRPLPSFARGPLATLLLLAAAVVPSSAQEAQPLPTCRPTVPVPPPEPPARPDGLVAERPPNPPIAEAPLPPERPAELPSAPAPAGDMPSGGTVETSPPAVEAPSKPAVPAPLPPPRPSELSSAPAELPSCTPSLNAPLPPLRPAELSPQPASPSEAPQPPQRPSDLAPPPALTDGAPLPPGRPPELSGDSALKLTVTPQDDTECLRNLDALGVKYAKLSPIVNGQCAVANPLEVTALGAGIGIGAPSTMVCRLAEGLMRWTQQVREIAEQELGDPLSGFTLGGTYVCRGQNHGTEAQLSEHAFANAVDVMGFTFAKRAPILVGTLPEGSKEAAFLSAVRKKACEHFTTVLGPGTDEPHANHLHLDERERRAGYRLCQ